MSKIVIEDRVYQIHPIYDLYGADEGGHIINIVKKLPSKGCKHHDSYMRCLVRKHGQNGFKSLSVQRFVWECFNGIITGDKVIDHINNIRDDNRLCNLHLMTQQQNCKKSAKARDYTFNAYNHLNRKYVKALLIKIRMRSHFTIVCMPSNSISVLMQVLRRWSVRG